MQMSCVWQIFVKQWRVLSQEPDNVLPPTYSQTASDCEQSMLQRTYKKVET